MMQLLKKSAFLSLGLAVLSAAAIRRIGQKIAEESKLSEAEGKKLIDDLLVESEKSKLILKKKVEKTVTECVSEMDVATSQDIAALNQRLAAIETTLSSGAKSAKTVGTDTPDTKKKK